MADIRVVHGGKDFALPNGSAIYVDGHKLRHVLAIVPDLTTMGELATVTITLAVSSFKFEPESDG